jgi:hypothetical protein
LTTAEWLYLLNLLDAVLQNHHDRVLVTESGQPPGRLGVLGGLHRQQNHPDGTGGLSRIGTDRAWHRDRIRVVRPKFDLRSRRSPADQHPVAGGEEVSGGRRADGARTDNCNIHDNH